MKTSDRIASLRDRLDLHIFLGSRYNNEPEKMWSIHLDYKWDEVKIEIRTTGPSLDSALDIAWARLSDVCDGGLPYGALSSPVEHTLIEPPAPASQTASQDDEIPF